MKKIGIVTLNDNNNYGNRLQNYAVQAFVKKLNCDVESIVNIAGIKKIKYKIKSLLKYFLKERYHNFILFNKNIRFSNIKIDNNQELKKSTKRKLNNKYDYFIVGSDQVWNPTLKRFSTFELLPFADNKKRISFAASFAINELPEDKKWLFKQELNKFKHISVREDAGKKIVEDLIKKDDVEVIVDPTMLLTEEEWDLVSKKPKKIDVPKKYILNYFLGELSNERKKEIECIAKENNCKIINILDKNDPFFKTGPSEFLYLEKNAFLICTDSFHSSVFAILYNRPFVVFNREDKSVNMNSRLETLLSKFELNDRYYTGKISKELLKVNYEFAYSKLEKEREKAYSFLKKALDINEE